MKITPLEIRQKSFEKKLRGFDKDEVNAFLLSLSQEWERLNDENKEFKYKLTSSAKEVEKLREVESSLYKTLKTAEDTGANMIEQANKTAELHLRETQMIADSLLNEAKTKARNLMEEADNESRRVMEEVERQIHELHQIYKDILVQKDALISDIRRLSNDNLDRVNKLDTAPRNLDIDEHMSRLKQINFPELPKKAKKEQAPPPAQAAVKDEAAQQEIPQKESSSDASSSFFDEIE
jgi:cell division initiation protein